MHTILLLVQAKQLPYINLQNQITTWTCFSHIQYNTKINQKLSETNIKATNYFKSHIFIIDNIKEKLYSPSYEYYMNRTEMQHLKAYYVTALNKHANQLQV
jgi:hypothetical protein